MAQQRQKQQGRRGGAASRVWAPTALSVALALSSVPITFLFNKAAKNLRPELILVLASLLLALITVAVKRLIPAQPKIFYGFALFAFTSVIDLLIPLEIDGFVSNFMDVYLINGEPYLFSSWGAIAAYWDGTFNLVCYLLLGFYVSNGLPYSNLALLYSSNILNSMIVLLLGAFLSHTGLHWCTLLNIPYVLLPGYVLWRALAEASSMKSSVSIHHSFRQVTSLILVMAAVFNSIRGIASLGSKAAVMSFYRDSIEPIFDQKIPAPFAAVQGIVCLMYFAPAYVIMAIALHSNSVHSWVKHVAIITSGAALQAEVSLLGMAWHPLTQEQHRLGAGSEHLGASFLAALAHVLTLGAPLLVVILFSCPQALTQTNAKTPVSANNNSKPKDKKKGKGSEVKGENKNKEKKDSISTKQEIQEKTSKSKKKTV